MGLLHIVLILVKNKTHSRAFDQNQLLLTIVLTTSFRVLFIGCWWTFLGMSLLRKRILSIVSDHLFLLRGDMGAHGRSPFKGIKLFILIIKFPL